MQSPLCGKLTVGRVKPSVTVGRVIPSVTVGRVIPSVTVGRLIPRGEFRPRQTRQLPRAVDLKGRLLSCQSY